MDISELVHFAKAYQSLGGAVQKQLDDLLENPDLIDDLNPNALVLIRDFTKDCLRSDVTETYWIIEDINKRLQIQVCTCPPAAHCQQVER